MSIEVRRHADGPDDWNRLVERSPQSVVYHRDEWLRTVAEESGSTLHRLVGYKGQEPVGLFPLFELRKGPVRTVFSPPPDLGIAYLGPALLNHEKGKRRNRDSISSEFIRGCLSYVDEEIAPHFSYVKTTYAFSDVRPFQWAGFDVTPKFTFTLDTQGDAEELKSGFSRSLRRTIDQEFDREYDFREGGVSTIRFVVREMRNRYEAQGKRFRIAPSHVETLYARLPEGHVLPYGLWVDGELVGGKVCVRGSGVVHAWLESGKPDVDFPVNEVTTWGILRDALENETAEYDLYGADVERIAYFKAKFNPDLAQSYTLTKGTTPMVLLSKLYERL